MMLLQRLLGILIILGSFSWAQADCVQCTPVDFNKKIEINLLRPLLGMSFEQKIKYIQSFGIKVLKVQDANLSEVKTLAFLEDAVPVTSSKFIKLFEEGTVGLYMTPTNYMYHVQQPTILLLDTADHWTIIHEFAHFLFDRARTMVDGLRESSLIMTSEDAQEDFFEAKDKYRLFGRYLDLAHEEHMIQSFVNYAKVQLRFVKTFDFEETVIEKILRDIYRAEQPLGFTSSNMDRSDRYVHSTTSKGLQLLDHLQGDCEFLNGSLVSTNADIRADLNQVCNEALRLQKEALQLYKDLHVPHEL